jgi:hypothetical protein
MRNCLNTNTSLSLLLFLSRNPGTSLEGLRKTTKTSVGESPCPAPNLNLNHPTVGLDRYRNTNPLCEHLVKVIRVQFYDSLFDDGNNFFPVLYKGCIGL